MSHPRVPRGWRARRWSQSGVGRAMERARPEVRSDPLFFALWTQGGLNCLTHALPRCLPTPTEEADGNGYGAITAGGGVPWAAAYRVSVNVGASAASARRKGTPKGQGRR